MTFYEQLGIVIPGSVFLFGLVLYFPVRQVLMAKDGISVGELGIFVLLAYAAGHLIAAVGNALESVLWRVAGGMPSDWVVNESATLLSEQQIEQLRSRIATRFNIALPNIRGLDKKTWWPISRQIYADVAKNGKSDRIDTFNGNYGLNRGLCAACIALSVIALVQAHWAVAVGLTVGAIVFGYRTYRFGVHYGRELYMQFLVL